MRTSRTKSINMRLCEQDHIKTNKQTQQQPKKSSCTFGQTVSLIAIFSSCAAVMTALSAILIFNDVLLKNCSDELPTSTRRMMMRRSPLVPTRPWMINDQARPREITGNELASRDAFSAGGILGNITENAAAATPIDLVEHDNGFRPFVAWLMSFPNR